MIQGPGNFEFIAIIGVGSTFILDLWLLLVSKVTKSPVMNWGLPGRWLLGLLRGQLVLQDTHPETSGWERILGWLFHYGVGVFYAALLLLIWGTHYRLNPTFFPAFLIGVVLASFAGLFILIPGLGGGLCAAKVPNRFKEIKLLIVSHFIFAFAQYGLALSMT